MDIENRKRKCRYIEIQIKDSGEFTDVALLVDNINFLCEIEKIRKKYDLNYSLPPRDEEQAEEFLRKLTSSNNDLKKKFDADVEEIRKSFYRPSHFKQVIQDAIIYGKIIDGVYSRAYLEEQENFSTDNPEEIPDKKYSIVIQQRTTEKDILRAFANFKELLHVNTLGTKEEKESFRYGYWAELSLQKIADTKHSSIENLHHWYISGKKPLQIAIEKEGYTETEYYEMRSIAKSPMPNAPEKQKNYEANKRKLDKIKNTRNSIKTQLSDYRKLLSTANTTIL